MIRELVATNYQPPNSNPHSRCIMELTQAYLKSILHYDPETGILTRTKKTIGWVNIGDVVGYIGKRGYYSTVITFAGKEKRITLHRLAFFYMEGRWPLMIDHINGVKTDNRWINLREVTQLENGKNTKIHKNNKTGVSGVYWAKDKNKWTAQIKVNHKMIYLGRYASFDDAVNARKAAEVRYGFHDNHGRNIAGGKP